MVKYESGCVSCGLPCWGSACPYWKEAHFYCDKCGEEVEDLWKYDGKELCEDCLKESFEKVEANWDEE